MLDVIYAIINDGKYGEMYDVMDVLANEISVVMTNDSIANIEYVAVCVVVMMLMMVLMLMMLMIVMMVLMVMMLMIVMIVMMCVVISFGMNELLATSMYVNVFEVVMLVMIHLVMGLIFPSVFVMV